VLTGHLLKDTDYVNKYHTNSLVDDDGQAIVGRYGNPPLRISGGRDQLRDVLAKLAT